MDSASDHLQTLRELECRHEEVLRRLDELEKRITRVLAEQATGGKPRADFSRNPVNPGPPTGTP